MGFVIPFTMLGVAVGVIFYWGLRISANTQGYVH